MTTSASGPADVPPPPPDLRLRPPPDVSAPRAQGRADGWEPEDSRPAGAFPVPWSWLDAVGAFALSLVFGFVAAAVLFAVGQLTQLRGEVVNVLLLPLSLAVLGLTVLAYVRLRYAGQTWRLRGPTRPRLADVGAGLAFGLLAYLVITVGLGSLLELFARLAGLELPTVQEEFRQAARDPSLAPLFAVGAVVFAPIAEELFFRGLLFQALRKRVGLWPGILLSAVLFSLAHVQTSTGGLANGLVVVIIFPLGVTLAWLFHRRGTLVVPILVHAVFNLIGIVLMVAGFEGT